MKQESKEAAKKEIRLHKRMIHPNVIKLLDSYESEGGKLVMVTEFAEKYDLLNIIKKRQQ